MLVLLARNVETEREKINVVGDEKERDSACV